MLPRLSLSNEKNYILKELHYTNNYDDGILNLVLPYLHYEILNVHICDNSCKYFISQLKN